MPADQISLDLYFYSYAELEVDAQEKARRDLINYIGTEEPFKNTDEVELEVDKLLNKKHHWYLKDGTLYVSDTDGNEHYFE